MKKQAVIGLIILAVIILFLSLYLLNNNSKEEFNSTIEQLGFDSPTEYQGISATLVCQDDNCFKEFPTDNFNDCNLLWNSTYEKPSAVGKPVYYFTGIYDCENKKYIYSSESPPTKVKIAEIK